MVGDQSERYEVIEEFHGPPVVRIMRALDRETGERVLVRELQVPPNLRQEETERIADSFRARGMRLVDISAPHVARLIRIETEKGVTRQVFAAPEGRPVSSLLEGGRRFSVTDALRICADVAAAVAYLWAQGLPVACVNPVDVFLSEEGELTVLDSAIVDPDAAAVLLAAGMAPWDYHFAAPELLEGGPPTESAAVYSIAALLYSLLTGKPPYEGTTPLSLAEAARTGPPPRIETGDPTTDEALSGIMESALSPEPKRRFEHVEEFARRIADIAGVQQAQIEVAPVAQEPAEIHAPKRRGVPVWTVVMLLVVAAALGFYALRPVLTRPKTPQVPVTLATKQPQSRQPVRAVPTRPSASPPRTVQPPPVGAAASVPHRPRMPVTTSPPTRRAAQPPRVYGDQTPRQWATVHVRCDAPEAKVYLDGVYAGVAPVTMRHVAPGEHRLSIQAKGYKEWATDVTAIPDEPVTVIAKLTPQGAH